MTIAPFLLGLAIFSAIAAGNLSGGSPSNWRLRLFLASGTFAAFSVVAACIPGGL